MRGKVMLNTPGPKTQEPSLPQSTLTTGFLRNANFARSVGWGFGCPLVLWLFDIAQASTSWFAVAIAVSYLYPAAIGWYSHRVLDPVRLVMFGLSFEATALAIFSEVACADPVFILVSVTVTVINALSTRGLLGIAVVLPLFALTLTLAHGNLRAVPTIAVPFYLHALLGLNLMGYVAVVTHLVHSLTLRHAADKRELIAQKLRNDTIHQHLVSTIADPFVSDEAVLNIIGPELSEEQSQRYLRRVRSRQQWEAVGRQTKSIVHDAKNILVPIVGLSAVLEHMVRDDDDMHECMTDLTSAVQRLNVLIDQVNPPAMAPDALGSQCVIQHVASEVASLLESSLPSGIEIQVEYPADGDLIYVPIEAVSLHRCLMNLGTNALQAMTVPGQLRLRLHPANSYERARLEIPPDQSGITLSVQDSGSGIPSDVLPRIFDPYFSTKEEDGGNGLGLATTYALITDAGGSITVESKLGEGTTFRLSFPVVLGAAGV